MNIKLPRVAVYEGRLVVKWEGGLYAPIAGHFPRVAGERYAKEGEIDMKYCGCSGRGSILL